MLSLPFLTYPTRFIHVRINEPTLTHPNHQKFTICIMICPWCCTLYWFGKMYTIHPSLWYLAVCFYCLNLCVLSVLSRSASTNHWSFYCLHSFSFLECHIVGIIKYIAFSDWLFSLSNMYLKFLYVFSWLDSLFLFSSEYISIP